MAGPAQRAQLTARLDGDPAAGRAHGALDAAQKAKAVTSSTKTGGNAKTEAGQDNAVVPYQGIRRVS